MVCETKGNAAICCLGSTLGVRIVASADIKRFEAKGSAGQLQRSSM